MVKASVPTSTVDKFDSFPTPDKSNACRPGTVTRRLTYANLDQPDIHLQTTTIIIHSILGFLISTLDCALPSRLAPSLSRTPSPGFDQALPLRQAGCRLGPIGSDGLRARSDELHRSSVRSLQPAELPTSSSRAVTYAAEFPPLRRHQCHPTDAHECRKPADAADDQHLGRCAQSHLLQREQRQLRLSFWHGPIYPGGQLLAATTRPRWSQLALWLQQRWIGPTTELQQQQQRPTP